MTRQMIRLEGENLECFIGDLVQTGIDKNDHRYSFIAGMVQGGLMKGAYPNGVSTDDVIEIIDFSSVMRRKGEDFENFIDSIMFKFSQNAQASGVNPAPKSPGGHGLGQ